MRPRTNSLYAFQIRFTRQRPKPEASIIMPLAGERCERVIQTAETSFDCPLLRRRFPLSGCLWGKRSSANYHHGLPAISKQEYEAGESAHRETSHGVADNTLPLLLFWKTDEMKKPKAQAYSAPDSDPS